MSACTPSLPPRVKVEATDSKAFAAKATSPSRQARVRVMSETQMRFWPVMPSLPRLES